MDDNSDTLSSPRTVGSGSSLDSFQRDQAENITVQPTGNRHWSAPITECVKKFRGGGLIVSSVHFQAALQEAERIWVEEHADYIVNEGVKDTKENGTASYKEKDNSILLRRKDDLIGQLEMDLQRLTMENEELRISSGDLKLPDVSGTEEITRMYSELYNNEWGDAFTYLTKKKKVKEREAIEELLKIAETVFEFCDKVSRDQMLRLTETLAIPTEDRNILKKIHLPDSQSLPEEVMENLHQCRQRTSHHSSLVVEQMFNHSDRPLSKLPKNESFRQFTTKCAHCFWLMKLHSPPMHLSFKIKKRSPFYPEVVMPYGKPGSEIDFLVWPAVLLREGGPVVLKGIVQCM